MSAKEQRRIEVLTRLIGGGLSADEAALLLGGSARTLTRLRRRFEAQGAAGLAHGNRGRPPAHKTSPEITGRLRRLAGEGGPYQGFNTAHLCEMLAEREGLALGRSTLDRLLKELGLRAPRRGRPRRVFIRRERMAAAGMLVQVDASLHDWLQGRGPKMTLVGGIDDATGAVLSLRFHATETQDAYLLLLRTITLEHGLPMSVYHDRHTILRSPKQPTLEDELAGREPMSQVQRVMHGLGIESIAARTPQAKGRIERLWQTLQDRLVAEMALAVIGTSEAANPFLPDFLLRLNARFAQAPREPEPAWVFWEEGADLAYHFSTLETRVLRADQTLSLAGRTLLLDKGSSRPSGTRLDVRTTPEGDVFVYDGRTRLDHRALPGRPPKASPAGPAPTKAEPRAADPAAQARKRAWLYGPRA